MPLKLTLVGETFDLAPHHTLDEVIAALDVASRRRRVFDLADGGRLHIAAPLTCDWALVEPPAAEP